MDNTVKRIKNPDSLIRLGKQLRSLRELAGTPQGKVRGMRQATVSKIENGGDVTLDTVISYMSALGVEVALVPIGQGSLFGAPSSPTSTSKTEKDLTTTRPVDLLSEFNDLEDEP